VGVILRTRSNDRFFLRCSLRAPSCEYEQASKPDHRSLAIYLRQIREWQQHIGRVIKLEQPQALARQS
jgi:hypothetical protein